MKQHVETYSAIILTLLNDFRCHPIRRTDKCVSATKCSLQLTRNTKVGKFYMPVIGQEKISTLDITVYLVYGVQIC